MLGARRENSTNEAGLRRFPRARRRRPALASIVAFVLTALPVTPAVAGLSTVTGSMAWSGTMTALYFPCSLPCGGGSFTGTGTGEVQGIDTGGKPYAVTWSRGNAGATFDISADCILAAIPTLTGGARGQMTFSGGHFTLGGDGDPALLSYNFTWNLYGTTATVFIDRPTVSGAGGTVALAALPLSQSAAEVVPIPPVPTCAGIGQLNALISGVAAYPV